MKVLVIDPWCSDEYEVYTIGFCEGISEYVETTLVCNHYQSLKSNKYKIIPLFFRLSQFMKRNKLRSVVRGIEYIMAFYDILHIVKKEKFDVVHVQWALLHKVDLYFLSLIKKYVGKLVYTSHNVIPHVNGEKYIDQLKELHLKFDKIILHGNKIKAEYLLYFPEDKNKIVIQRHGVHLTQKVVYDVENVCNQIKEAISNNRKGKIVTFVGNIFFNKGADFLLKNWILDRSGSHDLLVVAGEITDMYKELNEIEENAYFQDNILYYPKRLNDDEFAYILALSDIIVIPYRHASMSGIVFSAAAFSKALIYTDTGVISEYVENTGCRKVEANYISIKEGIDEFLNKDIEELALIGKRLHDKIYREYNWKACCKELYFKAYL